MAYARVKYVETASSADQTQQLCFYNVTFYGADVSPAIAFGKQPEISVVMNVNWNIPRLNAAILDAVLDKSTELGLTVADTDIFLPSTEIRRSSFPRNAMKSWWYQKNSGNLTTFSKVGIAANPISTGTLSTIWDTVGGQYVLHTTAAPLDSDAGVFFDTGRFILGNQFRKMYVIRTDADISSQRLWAALADVGTTLAASDTPATEFVGFRFSTGAADVNWMLCTSNGVTQTTVDSGVAVLANTRYELEIDASVAGEVSFYINSIYVGTISTNLPAAVTRMGNGINCRTLVAATRGLAISHMGGEYL